MKKRILSILLTLCMVLCLMPTAVFAEGNEDTPTQALTSVDITFPKPEEGKKIGDGSAASASGLTFLEFGPALWQQDGEPKKLKADDTYEKDNIYLLYFAFYTQKPITDETALTFNGNPITRYEDYQALAEALNAYDGQEDAYLGLVMFSEKGTGDPSMKDLKDLYIIGLYAIIRAQEAQTPEDTVKEQFNLTSGGTYYFDLSAENILGTVNDALPDKTMHYVPFTYAGTVDAYALTSEMATTEEDAEQNKYPHSLFIADYNVTHTVSWDNLNTANLIFGKNYAADGVGYTLRAPSVGSGHTDSDGVVLVTPQSNEWDKILDKYDGYIKNWNKVHSWGQDTWSTFASHRVNRGHNSARYWYSYDATYSYARLGFRPVLEVLSPDALGADVLKVVTLDLGGGKLGDRSEDIQIIVKNGSEFTAPASEGLTRPDGNNEDYFKWLGSDGKLYAPRGSVPADVTKLTALFAPPEQFNLALGDTYYFDLSAENILGTVNDALPDKTMHYVPFTYAGTVDAYTLTSEMATTEEYAQQFKYLHSLFVADYAVKHTVSWNDLNGKNLIFGKGYAAGGVNYTLRAPSAGNHVEGPSSNRYIAPINNEWDTILQKSSGYIDNCRGVYSVCQDLYGSGSITVYRGYNSTRHWVFTNRNSNPNETTGFRPVLEVLSPDTLGTDGLKAVTLALGGGKLGDSSEDIQIIVKNGSEFTAPASDGLTRPDGNTEIYFKWLGSDGNLYTPGESVPANVTKLTAQFAGGSGGSGGGGSRKPSVTYYTLHFETDGGSAITDMREAYNTRISLTRYVPTRQGHTFNGWYSDSSLTNQVSEVSLTKNMTVYAGWRADENPDTVANPFTDASEKDWFYNDTMFVYKNGLMLGTSKTLFSPHGTVTRGMMATILWRMEGSLAPKGENSFTDVEAGRWYADAITWTAENGIFAGYSKDKFGPDDPITREQLTAIFYRYADYKGYKLTVTGNLDKFEDADKITDYAKMVMQWAVGNGLIKGKAETLLDPQGTATRAEIAAMLHRFIEKVKPMQAD